MGPILSRQKFVDDLDGSLRKNGFRRIDAPYLTQKNEFIYNRGTDDRSNFFVFVKKSSLGVFVKYFDPDSSKLLDGCMKRHLFTGLSSRISEKADEIGRDIFAASTNKPDHAYSLVLHGHWKSIDGKRFYPDDGSSSDKLVIRDMMFHHSDFDFTGHHNIVDLKVHERIKSAEAFAGISRAISTEVTLPLYPGKSNGPHLMIWSYRPETMQELEDQFLTRNDYRMIFPSLATYMDPGFFMQWLSRELELKHIAVGIAHPFAVVPLVFRNVKYGLFSTVGQNFALTKIKFSDEGSVLKRKIGNFGFKQAVAVGKVFGDGIAAFNGAVWDGNGKIEDKETRDFVEKLKAKYGIKGDTSNIHGFLMAKHMAERYGLFTYYEPDFHTSPWSNSLYFYLSRRVYSKLSHGHTWFLSDKRPKVDDIVEAMHTAKEKFQTQIRWVKSNGTMSIDSSLNGFFYSLQAAYWTVATDLNYLREFLWESYRRISDITK